MVTELNFTITLVSDAEPGTGFGTASVDQFVPRNVSGQLVIPASHIKGLMREELKTIQNLRGWAADVESGVLGMPYEREIPGDSLLESVVRLTDAVAKSAPKTLLITRTAVEETGTARDTSLRTTEAIPVGTKFHGKMFFRHKPNDAEDVAARLALLSIRALGSGRTRGSGGCVVTIEGEDRSPGELLRELDRLLAEGASFAIETLAKSELGPADASPSSEEKHVVLRLVFEAETPVCCPEIPVKTNVIASGFAIPASAVQGAILHRINLIDPELATRCFQSPVFRAWPLLPCRKNKEEDGLQSSCNSLPIPVRVSLTHRVAKLSDPEAITSEHFFDRALEIEPYDWRKSPNGAPLKASDGVLLRYADGNVRLWKAASMPHVVSAHGVHNDPNTRDGRNLYTIDAMAPVIWQGIVVMPEYAAEVFLRCINEDDLFALGKSRSVRGLGRFSAQRLDEQPPEWKPGERRDDDQGYSGTVLIVQSPVMLPDQPHEKTAEAQLLAVAKEWANLHGLPEPKDSWAITGIRFGWNRHGCGPIIRQGRLRACRVALPGSVIRLAGQADGDALADALLAGLGCGRDRGCGALSVHPGKAQGLYPPNPPTYRKKQSPEKLPSATRKALEIYRKASPLPSPSQIRAVQQRLAGGNKGAAIEYLKHQRERTSRIWFTWSSIFQDVKKLIQEHSCETAFRALEILADLAIADAEKKETRK